MPRGIPNDGANGAELLDLSPEVIKATLVEALGEKSKSLKLIDSLDEEAINAELVKVRTKIAALSNAAETLRGLAKMAHVLKHGRPPRATRGSKTKKSGAAAEADDEDAAAAAATGRGASPPATDNRPMVDRIDAYLRERPELVGRIAAGVRSSDQYVKQAIANNPDRFKALDGGKYARK